MRYKEADTRNPRRQSEHQSLYLLGYTYRSLFRAATLWNSNLVSIVDLPENVSTDVLMTIVEGAFGTLSQFKVAKDISKMIRLYDDEYGPFHRPWDVLFETDGPGKGKYLSVAKRLSSGCVEISYSDLQQFVLVNIERRILLNQSSSMSSIRDSVYKKVIFFSLIHHPDVPPIYPFKPHIVSDLESSPSEGPVVSPRGSEHPSELASHVDHDESNNTVCRDLQVTGLIYINKLYSHRAGLCTQRLEMSQVLPGQPVLTISAKTLVLTR